jgi:nucleoside 2-deoxyribosyltransferase
MRIYLAGAIEAAPNNGREWRRDLTPFLEDLGAQVFDPSLKEDTFISEEEKKHFRTWKTTDYNRFKTVIRKIIDRDLDQLLNKTDLVICLWDEHVIQGGGTHGELTLAYRFGIPVYMVLGMDQSKTSSWILGCVTELFHDYESLKLKITQDKIHT